MPQRIWTHPYPKKIPENSHSSQKTAPVQRRWHLVSTFQNRVPNPPAVTTPPIKSTPFKYSINCPFSTRHLRLSSYSSMALAYSISNSSFLLSRPSPSNKTTLGASHSFLSLQSATTARQFSSSSASRIRRAGVCAAVAIEKEVPENERPETFLRSADPAGASTSVRARFEKMIRYNLEHCLCPSQLVWKTLHTYWEGDMGF